MIWPLALWQLAFCYWPLATTILLSCIIDGKLITADWYWRLVLVTGDWRLVLPTGTCLQYCSLLFGKSFPFTSLIYFPTAFFISSYNDM